MNNLRIFTLVSAALGLLGCTTTGLHIESQPPGADVLVSVQGQPPRKAGVTPMELTEFSSAGSPPVQVTASLAGRVSQSAYVPSSQFAKRGQLFFQLDQTVLPAACEKQQQSLQKIALGVAQVQSQIAGKNLDQAIASLGVLVAEFADVSVLYDLLGNAYYLRKDLDTALKNYKRSYEINPNNPETERMIKKIQSLRGGA